MTDSKLNLIFMAVWLVISAAGALLMAFGEPDLLLSFVTGWSCCRCLRYVGRYTRGESYEWL